MYMVKDLQYFLDEENAFCKEHPDYGETCCNEYGELSEVGISDRLNYLSDRVFSKAYKSIKGPLGREMYKKLYVYAGPDHKHAAQKPEVLTF